MKICYENLEQLRYNIKKGTWGKRTRYGSTIIYRYRESCAFCGEPFLFNTTNPGIFCSTKCSNNGQKARGSRKRVSNPNWKGGEKKATCAQCGKEFYRKKAEIKKSTNNFCGRECLGKWQSFHNSGKNSATWRGGISCEPYCPIWKYSGFKEYLFERDGYKCQNPECSGNYTLLNRHHIDYDKKNCDPKNIITLCVSCNSHANKDREWHTAYYNAIMFKRNNINVVGVDAL